MFYRPYAIVEGDGFKELASKLISIGATYSKIGNVNEILPTATTVSRHLCSMVSTAKERFIKQLESVKQFSINTNAWTHQHMNDCTSWSRHSMLRILMDGTFAPRFLPHILTMTDTQLTTFALFVQSILEECCAVRTGNGTSQIMPAT